jgi:formate--tetrahydrofolate ligase
MSTPTTPLHGLPPRRISEVARELGLNTENILPHGHYIAKIPISELEARQHKSDGHLILMTAMTPTPQGEGKTTATIGLADALRRLEKKSMICVREPSLGPYFGVKGGGTGGGHAQIVPAEDINLHFVGDMYAVEKANNLLCAMMDNHLQHGNALGLDPRRIVLRRVMDLNERALRDIVIGLGGTANGVPRRDGFNITPASEIMAILCLSKNFADLGKRMANIVVGFTYKGEPVRAESLKAVGAMQVLLRDAINPNLVQSLEGTPALVHGGPFANIAQGTNTCIATRLGLKLADYVVTEAGFATDLGAEKFMHIKCRSASLKPSTAVIVATTKAIEFHGGYKDNGGIGNLGKHIENIQRFGIDPVVCISNYPDDKPADYARIKKFCAKLGVEAVVSKHFDEGGKGAKDLAEAVLRTIEKNKRKKIRFLYSLEDSIEKKIETLATQLYGADGVDFDSSASKSIKSFNKHGFGKLPICVAKTAMSLSDNPDLRGRPKGFRVKVNELRLSAGAGFIVAICGSIVTMPGLPKVPAAEHFKVIE